MRMIPTKGFLLAVDGPNGAGKSTLIEAVKNKLEIIGYETYLTKEPTNTELGAFVRRFSENHVGIGLACLVAADRYEHIENEILPELNKGKIVITDRYFLSTLILQEMDNVCEDFLFNLNSEILQPNLQVAVFADEEILQKRLSERSILTRFEKQSQSHKELLYMKKGIIELKKRNISVLCIKNNSNLNKNAEKVVSQIVNNWRVK